MAYDLWFPGTSSGGPRRRGTESARAAESDVITTTAAATGRPSRCCMASTVRSRIGFAASAGAGGPSAGIGTA